MDSNSLIEELVRFGYNRELLKQLSLAQLKSLYDAKKYHSRSL